MDYDINALPRYLRKDLLALQEAIATPNQQLILDCLQCELLGSINAARTGHEISDELADYLIYEYIYERDCTIQY